jgi:uncharacterized protein (DUF1800 family)
MNIVTPPSTLHTAALAAHRFGLGEPRLDGLGADPRGWLAQQIGPADPQVGAGLADSVAGLQAIVRFRQIRAADAASRTADSPMAADTRSSEMAFTDHFRAIVQADLRARLVTQTTTARPFAERLALFWANHFTVSMAKASARGLVGAFEREAIRPHIAGRFHTLLAAAVKHPAMLRYLDNDQSAGPDSRLVQRLQRQPRPDGAQRPQLTGLNENLAREILELHTLGVTDGPVYTQADVTAFARVLTGWRAPLQNLPADGPGSAVTRFDPAWHQPGRKVVLGRAYDEGPQALDQALAHLAQHPSTARFVATKLARHFVADQPPSALVDRLAQAFLHSEGDLTTVYTTLLQSPEAWQPQAEKLKTPEEFVVSTARVLASGPGPFARQPDGGLAALGQRLQAAPSPAGWPDRADEWLGPDAVWKRVEWAARVAERAGRQIDARALADASLGPLLSNGTRRQVERAADGPQALALLLMSPEFQRR